MCKAVVVGSLNLDTSITLERMPQPGETIAAQGISLNPGGKGANQAFALGRLGWGAALWVVLAMVGRRFRPAQLRIPPRRPDVQRPVRRLGLLRAALYALALLLLILGVGNQGMRDVLVKAIQICTECIGLG